MKILRVTYFKTYVYGIRVILDACDVDRLVWFLYDKSLKNSGDRVRRLEWSAL
jgi:hypothetical protein